MFQFRGDMMISILIMLWPPDCHISRNTPVKQTYLQNNYGLFKFYKRKKFCE